MTDESLQSPPPPADGSVEAQVKWLEQMVASCRRAGGPTCARLAEALERSRLGLLEMEPGSNPRSEGRQLGSTLQALGIWTLIQQLSQVHSELVHLVAGLEQGDERRAVVEKQALDTERTLDALADAYDALRAGDTSKLAALGPRLSQQLAD